MPKVSELLAKLFSLDLFDKPPDWGFIVRVPFELQIEGDPMNEKVS